MVLIRLLQKCNMRLKPLFENLQSSQLNKKENSLLFWIKCPTHSHVLPLIPIVAILGEGAYEEVIHIK